MKPLHWTFESKNDLDDIYDYYVLESPMVAIRMHNLKKLEDYSLLYMAF